MVKGLVFEGGAMAGISMGGTIQKLMDVNFDFDSVDTFVGTSFGSIIAMGLALEFDLHKFTNDILHTDYTSIMPIYNPLGMYNIFTKFGFYSLNNMRKLIKSIIKGQGIDPNIRFRDLNKNLVCTVTELKKGVVETFSNDTAPHMKIVDAVASSCAIPIIFVPFKYNGGIYCDGGVIANYNIKYFNEDDDIIGFMFKSKNESKGKLGNIIQYIGTLANLLYMGANEKHLSQAYWDKTVVIDIPEQFNPMNFNPSIEDRAKLFNNGYHIELPKV